MSDKIVYKYTKELGREKALFLIGSGGGFINSINLIKLHFESFDCTNLTEARKLYVNVIEELLYRINSNEEIRPYLKNYPFTISNLEIMIGFLDQNMKQLGNGHISLIFKGKGTTIVYEAYDPNKEEFYNICEEPYDEAKQIVFGH